MDIEGFEYESLTGLRFKDSCRFPAQIAIELHWTVRRSLLPCALALNPTHLLVSYIGQPPFNTPEAPRPQTQRCPNSFDSL